MGAVVRIEAYVPAGISPALAFRAAFDRVGELAGRLSSYRADSELRQLERKAWRSPTSVSEDFARVLGHAIELARQSDGAFDPTLGRVTRLVRAGGWGEALSEPSALDGVLDVVDLRRTCSIHHTDAHKIDAPGDVLAVVFGGVVVQVMLGGCHQALGLPSGYGFLG